MSKKSDIKMLQLFSFIPKDIVKSILEANNGDKENTINQLLAMS